MKYRTPANGEIVERDDIPASLIEAGIYIPVSDEKPDKDDGQTPTRHKPRR